MKRIFSLLLSAMMIFAVAGCNKSSGKDTPTGTKQTGSPAVSQSDTSMGSNTLVVYFSRTGEQYGVGVIEKGNTAVVADMIVEITGADTFEILPAEDNYPTTYKELTDFAKKEQNERARPVIAGELPNLSGYDTIFIGSPVWWGDFPMIVYTYLESSDFSGKTLVPFSTHAGSGLAGFDEKLETACPGAEIAEGLAIRGSDAQDNQDKVRNSVEGWLLELGY